jgi:hypothetical protein
MKIYADNVSVKKKIKPKATPSMPVDIPEYKPSSHVSVEGDHADALHGVRPGKAVHAQVSGTLKSLSHRVGDDGKPRSSGSIDLDGFTVVPAPKKERSTLSDMVASRQHAKGA